MAVYRVYTEKKPDYAVEARALRYEIRHILRIPSVQSVRVLNRYDVEGLTRAQFERCLPVVFFEPQVDACLFDLPEGAGAVLAAEALPGQYDARAASCEECVQLLCQGERPTVRAARVYLFGGDPTPEELARIRRHLINPVESREASLAPRDTLAQAYPAPAPVETLTGFTAPDGPAPETWVRRYGLAMDADDLACCRAYFAREGRDPTHTELRVLDTYWSDHCRHTTFGTVLDSVTCNQPAAAAAYGRYRALRREMGRDDRPVTLMDMATLGARALRARGLLPFLDESEEINACSVRVDVPVDGKPEPWLLQFKNETHNHPTEIEPFGGAATCIGGAIRDPLSGRTYVYQAMRVTGAADPLAPVADTLPGKLPQRKLTTTAAAGYSAYGNQIGLATGQVEEFYHPGYAAKRMEIGAVLGAAPLANIRRERPVPGDVVVLLGGRTGRDGCGGATGSSKSHSLSSLETCGAEVQKGNPVVEHKLQRLFRDPRATRLIKRCNDFGAGGVSVAIGELADGLLIELDRVPRKYEGLDGTELAISESQERMAVVVAPEDAAALMALADAENLEATPVATVTEEPRLRMVWQGREIVNLRRAFLDTNGAEKHATAVIADDAAAPGAARTGGALAERLTRLAGDLNLCSRKGLAERFDSTIGAATVLMPYGGRRQLTPVQAMVAKLPVLHGETTACSGMAFGFHPARMERSPYAGAYLNVAESLCKLAAAGFDRTRVTLSLQEYFCRMTGAPERWGLPAAALLGALDAQLNFGVAAIGGKDSMSGTFETLDVPPTLVSFAVAPGDAGGVISPEFKGPGHALYWLEADPFDAPAFLRALDLLHGQIAAGRVLAAWAAGEGGVAEGLLKMALGNAVGVRVAQGFSKDLFAPAVGGFILELAAGPADPALAAAGVPLGETMADYALCTATETCPLDAVQETWESKLEKVFPYRAVPDAETAAAPVPALSFTAEAWPAPALRTARPVAVIPMFPGTNCEVDTARALERAGAEPRIVPVRNLTPAHVARSVEEMAAAIRAAQMVVFPGGFSGGDEPDGSAKLIAAFFRNPAVREAAQALLDGRDGLMLGICNGFQALIKLGLLPFGRITEPDAASPTLTFNTLGRHQSMLTRIRVASTRSPWLRRCRVGETYTVPVSHGEGRFVCGADTLNALAAAGQIATQYVGPDGLPTMDLRYNPNGSVWAVEGITSPDGRVLGKMGHTERSGRNLYLNVEGNTFQPILEAGVAYFR
ncbi:MAG: phosphoribosylformylglycinamidine synthase [Candidatus Limiplasma sp.]|nr:phosphoribosylformylglycinamidine synthase [Candidatus Limiplasma sp.]